MQVSWLLLPNTRGRLTINSLSSESSHLWKLSFWVSRVVINDHLKSKWFIIIGVILNSLLLFSIRTKFFKDPLEEGFNLSQSSLFLLCKNCIFWLLVWSFICESCWGVIKGLTMFSGGGETMAAPLLTIERVNTFRSYCSSSLKNIFQFLNPPLPFGQMQSSTSWYLHLLPFFLSFFPSSFLSSFVRQKVENICQYWC